MYMVKIGNDTVRVVDKDDAKTLTSKLFDMGCDERVSTKLVIEEDDLLKDGDADVE